MTTASARKVLLVGGTSEIGLAIVRRLAADGPLAVTLSGRRRPELERVRAELGSGQVTVGEVIELDADEPAGHEAIVAEAFERAGGFDVVVLAVGLLGAQEGIEADPAAALDVMRVNFVGTGSLAVAALRALRRQGHGTLIVLSSVAGERGRASNAVYGAAKAGLDTLVQGLADSLASTGVHVLVVRPGFVRTRMTAGLPEAPLSTTPEAVADATIRGLARGAHTVWVPGSLRYLFIVLRHLPRPIWRRLPL